MSTACKMLRTGVLIAMLFGLAQGQGVSAPDGPSSVKIARLKYFGGSDWYWGPSSLPNLIDFVRKNTPIQIAAEEERLTISDEKLFNYPFLYLTGHGPIKFSDEEAARLRLYLSSGGFLFANDSYGLKPSFMEEMKKVFPGAEPQDLPFDYGLFNCYYTFPDGLPKIHKHDGKPPQAFGWFVDGRLVVVLAYESDIGDGWEDPTVHNDPPDKREAALRMGVNLLTWALTN